MSKTAISLLVHEKPDVFRDQIENIGFFFPEAYVIVHVSMSSSSPYEEFVAAVRDKENVLFNPNRIHTQWGDLLGPKLLNIKHALKELPDLDHVTFSSSNDMFVRHGVSDYIKQYPAGYDHLAVVHPQSNDKIVNACFADPSFKNLIYHLGINHAVYSQIEGSFYNREIASEMVMLIEKHFDISTCGAPYYREEFIFSTVAHQLMNSSRQEVASPYTLKGLFAYEWARNFGYRQKWMMLPSKVLATVLHNTKYPSFWRLDLLKESIRHEFSNLAFYANAKNCRKFSPPSIFAVKQVRRDLDDPVRQYLKGLRM